MRSRRDALTRIHQTLKITDDDWIQGSLNEARSDPVGMWVIVRGGREGFGLSGLALENFVRRCIEKMVTAGAVPLVGDKGAKFGWRATGAYGHSPTEIADALISEWKTSGADPDVGGVWFGLPSAWQ